MAVDVLLQAARHVESGFGTWVDGLCIRKESKEMGGAVREHGCEWYPAHKEEFVFCRLGSGIIHYRQNFT